MATINAESCSYAHVSAAITAATTGDTVVVPAGSATWSSRLEITKGITLIGSGGSNVGSPPTPTTLITSGYTGTGANTDATRYLITLLPSAAAIAGNHAFRVSGFSLNCANICSAVLFRNGTTTLMTQGRLDHCSITNTSNKCVYVYGCSFGGCVDNNTISVAGLVFGAGGGGAAMWLAHSFYFGNQYNMYFEDNTVTSAENFVDGGNGAQYCLRYNAWTYTGTSEQSPSFDMHGADPDAGNMGGFITEVYENTLVSTNNKRMNGLNLRGGKGLFYNNAATTSASYGLRSYVSGEHNDSTSTPSSDPDGNPLRVNDSYFFGNTINGTAAYVELPFQSSTLYDPELGREWPLPDYDFWPHNPNFDGHTQNFGYSPLNDPGTNCAGMGVGLLAARPSSGLTVGVGYWATDVLNDDGTYGKLYRATSSTTWETFYTPYEYPHPLRGETPTGWANTFDAIMKVSESETARL
jgi:hypothetical protein